MQRYKKPEDTEDHGQDDSHTAHSRKGNRSYQHLTPEQVQPFLHAVHGHPLEALCVLALTTGMRRTELMTLTWLDVDLPEGILRVCRVPKGARTAEGPALPSLKADPTTAQNRQCIALTRMALNVLTVHRTHQQTAYERTGKVWQEDTAVFSLPTGQSLDPYRDVFVPFKRLLAEAGLPSLRFHDLRHSFAFLLLSIGIHPTVIAGMLGYPVVGMTMVNTDERAFLLMQQEAMEKLDRLLHQ